MVIILIFSLSAIIGGVLLAGIMKGKSPNSMLSMGHGSLAVMGIFFLGLELYKGNDQLNVVFAIFLLGAIGGFYLSYRDYTKQNAPKPILAIHVGAGLLGFILLIVMCF